MSNTKGILGSDVFLTHPKQLLWETRDKLPWYLCKESDFIHSDWGSVQQVLLLPSCTVYSPPRARMILLQPTAAHVTPLLKNPPVASIIHCVKCKILTMTSKPQHYLSFGSFVYLISCPSSLNLLQPTTLFCLSQIFQAHSPPSPGPLLLLSPLPGMLPSPLARYFWGSFLMAFKSLLKCYLLKVAYSQYMMYLFVGVFVAFLPLDYKIHRTKNLFYPQLYPQWLELSLALGTQYLFNE